MVEDSDLKQYLLNFIHQADFNISDVKSDIVKRTLPQNFINMMLSDNNTPSDIKEKLKKIRALKA